MSSSKVVPAEGVPEEKPVESSVREAGVASAPATEEGVVSPSLAVAQELDASNFKNYQHLEEVHRLQELTMQLQQRLLDYERREANRMQLNSDFLQDEPLFVYEQKVEVQHVFSFRFFASVVLLL